MIRHLVPFAAGLAFVAGPALAQEAPDLPGVALPANGACPDRLPSEEIGLLFGCHCSAEDVATGRTVWGSGPYTADSALCVAARHRGVVGAEGGVVYVQTVAGLDSYDGTEANGVTTSGYGSFGASMQFVSLEAEPPEACPANARSLRGTEFALTCSCEANPGGGTVWGADPYTDDSAICRAAVHAGAIGAEGGIVTIVPGGAQTSFEGTEANGISTSSYGAWDGSFTFR